MSGNDPLDGLDDIDWVDLWHAYGSAEKIPQALRALRSESADERKEAMDEGLWHSIWHQGSRYPASVPAARFLVRLAADPATRDRHQILDLLEALVTGQPSDHLPLGIDAAAWRADMEYRRTTDPEEQRRRLDAWVDEEPEEPMRSWRKRRQEQFDPVAELGRLEIELEVYDAVRAGVPALRPLLNDQDPAVRAGVVRLLAWFPEEAAESVPMLDALLDRETDDLVISDLISALGLLGHRPAVPLFRDFVAGGDPLHRVAAAVALIALDEVDETVVGAIAHTAVTADWGVGGMPNPFSTLVSTQNLELALGLLEGREVDADSLGNALAGLRDGPLTRRPAMAGAALVLAFGAVEDVSQVAHEPEPFEDLEDEQRETVLALAGQPPEIWEGPGFRRLLDTWGLPDDRAELREYAGLPED
ncbi:HEAT repeat domain-containing protein [Spirillospora sp. CA-255316]